MGVVKQLLEPTGRLVTKLALVPPPGWHFEPSAIDDADEAEDGDYACRDWPLSPAGLWGEGC